MYSSKSFTLATALILGTGLLFAGWVQVSLAGDIYYYEDKQGVLHFTDLPDGDQYQAYFTGKDPGTEREKIMSWVRKYSSFYGLEPELVQAVLEVESNYHVQAESRAGAQGLMQIMPDTQKDLGLQSAFDPQANIEAGVRYLSELWHNFPPRLALAAYNAGPAQVQRYNGIPPFTETQNYVQKVFQLYSSLKNKN